ncbi:hypothetical protein H4219_000247 [Mycoemilia scoparia]|uniref:Major facilitator superfamily (MFS) profile domain-containing protein n=1 Tax=Mycoemilia scoparia TaxID=417184 RepID=A0A9W8A9D6_9FUNG|nr:hypothetical protein H4219_000247 [Mycoemilia scoparia]
MKLPSWLKRRQDSTQRPLTSNGVDDVELPPETPLPWDQIITLLIVRITEPINFTMILPFMYFMVKDFNVAEDPKDIAWYAGVLAASFSVCQTMTVMSWGSLSDRIGRRPVILMGMAGNFISFLLFGLSKSFWMAMVARCINGLLNGNVGVAKSIMGELTDNTNRSRGFAMLPLCWNLGAIIGPTIGGFLSQPAKQYPGIFGGIWLFETFPYLLPCMIGSSLSLFGIIYGYFNLKETLNSGDNVPALPAADQEQDTRTSTKNSSPSQAVSTRSSSTTLPSTSSTASPHVSPDTEETPLLESTTNSSSGALEQEPPKPPKKVDIFTPLVVKVLLTNLTFSLAFSISEEVYPIWAASDISVGGLGFNERMIGFSLAMVGFTVIYLQLFVYPNLERRKGCIWCYRRGLTLLIPYHVAIPFLSYIAGLAQTHASRSLGASMASFNTDSPAYFAMWGVLIVLLLLRMVGTVLCFTSINIILTNVAPSTSALGKLNGAQQLIASTMRMAGPILAGILWSTSIKHTWPFPFNSHLVWNFSAVLFFITILNSTRIPNTVNRFAAKDREDRLRRNGQ